MKPSHGRTQLLKTEAMSRFIVRAHGAQPNAASYGAQPAAKPKKTKTEVTIWSSGRAVPPAKEAYRVLRKGEPLGAMRQPNWDRLQNLYGSQLRREMIGHVGFGFATPAADLKLISATPSLTHALRLGREGKAFYGNNPIIIRIDLNAFRQNQIVWLGTPTAAAAWFNEEAWHMFHSYLAMEFASDHCV